MITRRLQNMKLLISIQFSEVFKDSHTFQIEKSIFQRENDCNEEFQKHQKVYRNDDNHGDDHSNDQGNENEHDDGDDYGDPC